MLRLTLLQTPYWMDLGGGVRLKVRPLTFAVLAAAQSKAYRLAVESGVAAALVAEIGGDVPGLLDLDDQDARNGLCRLLMLQSLAVFAVIEWEGVGNEDGTAAAPVTEAWVKALILGHPLLAEKFEKSYTAGVSETVTEGNVCGIAPSGTSAAVPNIADVAAPTDCPAPGEKKTTTAKPVPTPPMNPEPLRDGQPGNC